MRHLPPPQRVRGGGGGVEGRGGGEGRARVFFLARDRLMYCAWREGAAIVTSVNREPMSGGD